MNPDLAVAFSAHLSTVSPLREGREGGAEDGEGRRKGVVANGVTGKVKLHA